MAATNNRSWLSASSSIGSSHDESMDSSQRGGGDFHNTSQGSGRSSARNDRYNHYRKDPVVKVKPWLRDKAVTGAGPGGSARKSRFMSGGSFGRQTSNNSTGSNGNQGAYVLSEASVGSNSCANSVCSANSFQDSISQNSNSHQQHQNQQQYAEGSNYGRSLSNASVESNDVHRPQYHPPSRDEFDEALQPPSSEVHHQLQEEQPTTTSSHHEDIFRRKQQPDQHVGDNNAQIHFHHSLSLSRSHDEQDEVSTADTEAASTAETPVPEATCSSSIQNDIATIEEPVLVEPNHHEEDAAPIHDDKFNDHDKDEKKEELSVSVDSTEEASPTTDESFAAPNADKDGQHNEEIEDKDDGRANMVPYGHTIADHTDSKDSDEQRGDAVDDDEDDTVDNDDQPATPAEPEFYDTPWSVQPSSYNPMKAVIPGTDAGTGVSVAAYATMEKPTPLVTEQAALLQNAICEEDEEEEEDDDEVRSASSKDEEELEGEAVNTSLYVDAEEMPMSMQPEAPEFSYDKGDQTATSEMEQNEDAATHMLADAAATTTSTASDFISVETNNTPADQQPEHTDDSVRTAQMENKFFEKPSGLIPQDTLDEMQRIRREMARLIEVNKETVEKLRLAEDQEEEYIAHLKESKAEHGRQVQHLEGVREELKSLENKNEALLEKLQEAENQVKDQEAKNADAAAAASELVGKIQALKDELAELGQSNDDLEEKLRLSEECIKLQESRNADSLASAEAQAQMMHSLCEDLKKLEETNADLQQKLKASEEQLKEQEVKTNEAAKASEKTNQKIDNLNAEIKRLGEANASLVQKLKDATDREKLQASREQNITLVHVGDMPVDVGRLRVQCQKYFNCLRVAQLKNHCIRDKSPVKLVVPYNPKARNTIDIQAMLDKGSAIEAQDTTYLFKSMDTFNKGHFHTHKLLIPWKIVSTDGKHITRAEFFSQVWQQMKDLQVVVGDKKTAIPLFQECMGTLIPMPNAVLEGKLQCTPAELERIFAGKIAPYYRAIGRLMMQCIAATADDNSPEHSLKIAGSMVPMILRHKLFRGVDPVDESYPLENLLDHAFSLLGINDMTRDKAFEYFGIDSRSYPDTKEAVKRIRVEVNEMWIKERSLAIGAFEEGLTLNGLADLSFCCGLVPLEAVSEIFFEEGKVELADLRQV